MNKVIHFPERRRPEPRRPSSLTRELIKIGRLPALRYQIERSLVEVLDEAKAPDSAHIPMTYISGRLEEE